MFSPSWSFHCFLTNQMLGIGWFVIQNCPWVIKTTEETFWFVQLSVFCFGANIGPKSLDYSPSAERSIQKR